MEALPDLPPDLVAVLATVGPEGPVAIPVSALRRAGDRRLLFALAERRESTARLRSDSRAAMSLNGPGFSLCVEGVARVRADPLPGFEGVVAFELRALRLRDARGPHTQVDSGIGWRWTSPAAAERHAGVMRALADLARGGEGDGP